MQKIISNPDTVIIIDTMEALGLQQHVQGPTHKIRNTLDLISTQLEMQLTVTGTATHGFVSDHCMGINRTLIKKSVTPTIRKEFRYYSKIMPQKFTENYTTPLYSPNTMSDEACYQFKEELLKTINQTAPLKIIKCSYRQKHPWHNKFIKEQKRVI